MIVELKGQNPKIIPITDANNITIVDRIVLLPGMNDVSDEKWEKARKNLTGTWEWSKLKEHKTEKQVEVEVEIETEVNGKTVVKKNKKLEKKEVGLNFSEVKEDEAKSMIDNCYNVKTLEDWKEQTNYDNVKSYINKRLENIAEGKIK